MESATGCVLVSTATSSAEAAREIAAALVAARLAACVQITPIESHYRWQGEVQHEPEFLLQIKTTASRFAAVEALIKQLHAYDLPEIAAIPIVAGSAAYLAWIVESVDG